MNKLSSGIEAIEETKKRNMMAKAALESENGQVLLSMLLLECDPNGEMLGETPQKTGHNLGKRDVFLYITEIMARDYELEN